MEWLSLIAGLGSAAAWGASDFAGGLASRRYTAIRVILVSQLIGAAGLIGLILVRREALPPPSDLFLGAAAGIGGGLGLFLLYYSLAQGKMGVAAPLTAVASAGIPLLAGIRLDGFPPPVTLAGFGLALLAIWVISHPHGGDELRPGDVVLPLLAGVGFGVYLTLLGRIESEGAVGWPLLASRVVSIATLTVVLLAWRQPPPEAAVFPWALTFLAGIGDAAGSVLYAVAAQAGRLDVAAVLGSLYPAATVLLARGVLHERLSPRQNIGVAMVLAAVVLIAL